MAASIKFCKQSLGWIAMAFVAMIFSFNVKNFIMVQRAPMQMVSSGAVNPILKNTETLKLIYVYDHIRICDTTLIRVIESKSDHSIVYRDKVPGGATPIGAQKVVNPFDLAPLNLPPGKYAFRIFVTSMCADHAFQTVADDVDFTIIE